MKKILVLGMVLLMSVICYANDVMIRGITLDNQGIHYFVLDDSGMIILSPESFINIDSQTLTPDTGGLAGYGQTEEILGQMFENTEYWKWILSEDTGGWVSLKNQDTNVWIMNSLSIDSSSISIDTEGLAGYSQIEDVKNYLAEMLNEDSGSYVTVLNYDSFPISETVDISNFPDSSNFVLIDDVGNRLIMYVPTSSFNFEDPSTVVIPTASLIYGRVNDTTTRDIKINSEGNAEVVPTYLQLDSADTALLTDTAVEVSVNGYLEIEGDADIEVSFDGSTYLTVRLSNLYLRTFMFYIDSIWLKGSSEVVLYKIQEVQ